MVYYTIYCFLCAKNVCFLHEKIRPAMGRTLVFVFFLSTADIYQHDFVFISNPNYVMRVSKPAAYNQLCSGF